MRIALALAAPLGLAAGCACEEGTPGTQGDGGGGDGGDGGGSWGCETPCEEGTICCNPTGECEQDPYVKPGEGCADPSACANGDTLDCQPGYCLGFIEIGADVWDEDACEVVPQPCECVEAPPLFPGLIGRHSEVAAAGGVLFVSAYEEQFGDLVLGTATQEDLATIDWEPVDGVPAVDPTNAPSSWRGGVSSPGDDVGFYTSVAVGSDSLPRVAYHDASNGVLKFVQGGEKFGFVSHVVDSTEFATVGLYASLALGPGDVPVVAYMAHDVDVAGVSHAQARVASAATATPTSSADWTVTTLEDVAIPCTGLCAGTQVCVAASWTCETELDADADCAGACVAGEGCVDLGAGPVCAPTLPEPSYTDVPWGVGLWSSLALFGDGRPAVAYHLRVPESGELHAAIFDGAAWGAPLVLDAGDDRDVGQSASLALDAGGVMHLAYVEALYDDLVYMQWSGGVLAREIVDTGDRGGGDLRVVGADSTIAIGGDGLPRIVYQDQTASDLLLATRTAPGAWTLADLAVGDPGFGFYADLALDGAALYASTFVILPLEDPPGDLQLMTVP